MNPQNSISRKIAGNLAALSGGVTLGRAFGLVWLPYLTRRLDPSDLGIYILVGAIGAVLTTGAQWGSGAAAVRLFSAQDKNRTGLLAALFQVRLAGAALLCIGLTATWWLTGHDRVLPWLLLLATPGMAADMLRTPLNSWQLAHDRPLSSIALDGSVQFATRLAGVVALELGAGLGGLIGTMAAIRVLALPVAGWLWWSSGTRPSLRHGREHLARFLRFSAPFGVVAALLTVDARIDLFMLSLIPGQLGGINVPMATATGLYAVPLRIIGAVLLPLEPLRAALVPTLVRLVKEDRSRAGRLYVWVSRVITGACAVPALIGLGSLAPIALRLAAPESFHSALPTLQVLCFALVFRISRIPSAAAASVHTRPSYLVAPAAATLVSNVLLNLVLIPVASHLGAAIATALASAIGYAVYRNVALRVVRPAAGTDGASFRLVLLATAVTGIVFVVRPAILAFFVAGSIYTVGVFRSRLLRRDDFQRLRALTRSSSDA